MENNSLQCGDSKFIKLADFYEFYTTRFFKLHKFVQSALVIVALPLILARTQTPPRVSYSSFNSVTHWLNELANVNDIILSKIS